MTRRGRALKVVAALKSLAGSAEFGPVDEICNLFNGRRAADGEWLHELRELCRRIEADDDYPGLAVACLQSVLDSMVEQRHMQALRRFVPLRDYARQSHS